MFSATFPDSIRQITKNYQNKPVSIEVGKENRSLENIKQTLIYLAGTTTSILSLPQGVKQQSYSNCLKKIKD